MADIFNERHLSHLRDQYVKEEVSKKSLTHLKIVYKKQRLGTNEKGKIEILGEKK